MKRIVWLTRNKPAHPQTLGDWLTHARQKMQVLPDEPPSSLYALIAHCLNQPGYWSHAHSDYSLNVDQVLELDHDLTRLLSGEPLPYITGMQSFYGLDFVVSPAVLIPRPETELLIDSALDWLNEKKDIPCLVADVGTGSGCIAITIAHSSQNSHLLGVDISYPALQIARKNCAFHKLENRIDLLQSDLLSCVGAQLDLLCANLPYIPSVKLADLQVARHEPAAALDGGADGLDCIRKLMRQARDRIKPGGLILLEMESSQTRAIQEFVHSIFPQAGITIIHDLNQLPRLAKIVV